MMPLDAVASRLIRSGTVAVPIAEPRSTCNMFAGALPRSLGCVGERGDVHDRAFPDKRAGAEAPPREDDLGPEPSGIVGGRSRRLLGGLPPRPS